MHGVDRYWKEVIYIYWRQLKQAMNALHRMDRYATNIIILTFSWRHKSFKKKFLYIWFLNSHGSPPPAKKSGTRQQGNRCSSFHTSKPHGSNFNPNKTSLHSTWNRSCLFSIQVNSNYNSKIITIAQTYLTSEHFLDTNYSLIIYVWFKLQINGKNSFVCLKWLRFTKPFRRFNNTCLGKFHGKQK